MKKKKTRMKPKSEHRTSIMLTTYQKRWITKKSKTEGLSKGCLVRMAIDSFIESGEIT